MMAGIQDVPVHSTKPFDPSMTSPHECNGIADGTLADNTFADNGSDSEWEYEYSTTETETFYITLDLPVAKLDAKVAESPTGGRLTKRKDKWLNSTHIPFVDDKRTKQGRDDTEGLDNETAKDVTEHNVISPETDATPEVGPKNSARRQRKVRRTARDQNVDGQLGDELSTPKQNGTNTSNGVAQKAQGIVESALNRETPEAHQSPSVVSQGIPHDIQILELHSKHPIVVYRNQQFECDWTENIGTELLFIKHADISRESEAKLPIVRELPGEVDLLAVSGVRVVGRPINLDPKEKASVNAPKGNILAEAQIPATETENTQTQSDYSLPTGVHRIPVGVGASEDRKAQARFLERLSAIKLKRGEHDEVTINAIPRKEGRVVKVREQKRKREKWILRNKHTSEQRKALARTRLVEFDALDVASQEAGGKGSDKSSRAFLSGIRNNKSSGAHSTSKQQYAQDQSMDEDLGADEEQDDEDEDAEEEDDEESTSATDDNTVADPYDAEMSDLDDDGEDGFGNERPMANGEEENERYLLRDEDYDMDDEDEDDPGPDVSNGFHPRSFNPENMDIDH